MKIIGTGLNGLIGSRIVELLTSKYQFENLNRENGVDITEYNSVYHAIKSSESKIVLHAAAYTDVKGAEAEKELKEKSMVWKVNVIGTQNVAKVCQELDKKMIHFSTDMVVGGDDMPQGGFTEEALPNPLNWYAQTKYEAEKEIQKLPIPWVILRLAYPYRAKFEKPDFARFFINKLKMNKPVSVLTDRIISPTFIDDIALALDILIQENSKGIFNVVGSQILSIYDAVVLISKTFDLDTKLVEKTTRDKFLVGRPGEPFSSALDNGKIRQLGVNMNAFEEGLRILKNQL